MKQIKKVIRVKDVAGYSPSGDEEKYMSRLLIDGDNGGSERLIVNHFTLMPGQKTYSGTHPEPYEEVYYILRGEGILRIGGLESETHEVYADTIAYIPAGEEHQLENIGKQPLEMLTMMPLHLEPGANTLYDARKRDWGTTSD